MREREFLNDLIDTVCFIISVGLLILVVVTCFF